MIRLGTRPWRTVLILAGLVIAGLLGMAWSGGEEGPTLRRVAEFRCNANARLLAILPEGQGLLTSEGAFVVLRDPTTGVVRRVFPRPFATPRDTMLETTEFVVSPNGRLLVWSIPRAEGENYPRFVVVDARTGDELAQLTTPRERVSALRFHPDGSLLTAVGWGYPRTGSRTSPLLMLEWETAGWTCREVPLTNLEDVGLSPVASPAEPLIAFESGTSSKTTLWRLDPSELRARLNSLSTHGIPMTASFTTDGRFLLVGTGGGAVEIWETAKGTQVGSAPVGRPGFFITKVVVDGTGRFAAAVGVERQHPRLPLWWKILRWLGVRLSPSRPLPEVVLWEVATRRVIGRLPREAGPVLSPDGRWLATSRGSALSLWEVPQ